MPAARKTGTKPARKAVAEATGTKTASKTTGRKPRAAAKNGNGAKGGNGVKVEVPKGYAAAKKAEAEAATPKGQAPRKPNGAKDASKHADVATPKQDDAKRERVEELSAEIRALLGQGEGEAVVSDDRDARKAERQAAREERESAREARKAEREARRNSPERVAQLRWRSLIGLAKQYRASTTDEELRKLLVVRVRTAFEEWLAAEDDVAEARTPVEEVEEKVAA